MKKAIIKFNVETEKLTIEREKKIELGSGPRAKKTASQLENDNHKVIYEKRSWIFRKSAQAGWRSF